MASMPTERRSACSIIFQSAIPVEATTPAASWSETFPPKLTGEVVAALKQKFKQNYPAEILLPETMPSLRLLSLMHHQKTKNEFRWVPWKFRLSQAKSEEITAGKTTRLAKAEGIHLHSLLLDSPPELQVENGSMGMHALRQTFETFSYAMAMKSISLEVGLFHWIWAAVFLQSDIATSLGKAAQSDIKSTDPSLCFYWAYVFHLYVYFIHCIDFCNFNFHVFDIFQSEPI